MIRTEVDVVLFVSLNFIRTLLHMAALFTTVVSSRVSRVRVVVRVRVSVK